MRYHWGLGVGHLHAHQPSESSIYIADGHNVKDMQDNQSPNSELDALGGTMHTYRIMSQMWFVN